MYDFYPTLKCTFPTLSRIIFVTGCISYVNATQICSIQKILYSEDPFPSNHPALHLTLPATWPGQPSDLAHHQTRPANWLGQQPVPALHQSLAAHPSCLPASPPQARLRHECWDFLPRPPAKPCQWRLYLTGASQSATPSNILYTPSNILLTPSNILCTPSNILCSPFNILCTLYNILRLRTQSIVLRTPSAGRRGTSNILRTPSNILHTLGWYPLQYSA